MVYSRIEGCIVYSCFMALVQNRLTVFYVYGAHMSWSPAAFLWIWLAVIPDVLVLLILFILLIYIPWKWPDSNRYYILFGLIFASFVLIILSSNILLLIRTGYTINWKVVLALKVKSTAILYWPEIFKFILILFSQLFLGFVLWRIGHSYVRKTINSHYFRPLHTRYAVVSIIFGLLVIYSTIVVYFPPVHSWKEPSLNVVLSLFPATFKYYGKSEDAVQNYWEKNETDFIEQFIRAPKIQMSQPTTILSKPVKHIFLIILESIRADVLPFNSNFSKTIGTKSRTNVTADDVSPFFNSLWNGSVRTTATTIATYTLKSLIGTLCGIYPLNVDFLEEASSKNKFYKICLPELLRQTFRTSKTSSSFRSAFFTSARDDFDRQRELIRRMKFDNVYSGFEVINRTGPVPDVGMFGPADSTILPLLWDWIDNNLDENKENKLMTSLLLTGTHEPFVMPPKERIYRNYLEDTRANKYLNTIRATDTILKTIIDGLKSRDLYNETLIVIVSDHGYAFRDWGRKSLAAWRVPFECAFLVPLMLHNPNLKAKQLDGQYTNMDILPTIMDALLSSQGTLNGSVNRLLNVQQDKLNSILSQYEGTSLLRLPNAHKNQRYTFHLDNPGNSHVIVKQYPRKLVYDVHYDEAHLFHLGYDPRESIDIISFDRRDYKGTYPDWIQVDHIRNSSRVWSKRFGQKNKISDYHKKLLRKNFSEQISVIKPNINRISLKEMLDWADATLELASIWTTLVKVRYLYGNITIAPSKYNFQLKTKGT
ncbi:unnamed protein product [Rotaria magnacalcarata]|uniref:Sulfatase N-terminal domain-containing protein n=2 Tax=Rotaria magnacalcarata TaxID=392030 RepID=A0A819HY44_9BILA|nr:unnamed protein product [Rotaria magnacalcarata]CAF2057939.1 unnamed protein product [Rotaria magnacalcarata]CAF3783789.1 unnamed protein product [Rotaria magnacalcarata]CAF3893398.1 unnamed protein product [Rotaria magnacalcarata]CAF3903243.1 unnamed protein product [Rotaria magnacalcarata]